MIEKKLTITNDRGLHFRPSCMFAEKANKYDCDVFVRHNDKTIRGKTSIHLFAACVPQGDEITIVCDGKDEKKAMAALTKLIKSFD